jgi:hypothetical protein
MSLRRAVVVGGTTVDLQVIGLAVLTAISAVLGALWRRLGRVETHEQQCQANLRRVRRQLARLQAAAQEAARMHVAGLADLRVEIARLSRPPAAQTGDVPLP